MEALMSNTYTLMKKRTLGSGLGICNTCLYVDAWPDL